MSEVFEAGGYKIELLVQGFPGKSLENGGLGWSAIVLMQGHGRVVLIDTGSFSARQVLLKRLRERGISRHDVTDLLLTHAHYDHIMNWTVFPSAKILIGKTELGRALKEDIETSLCSELYVRELSQSPQLGLIEPGDAVIPNVTCFVAPGHTEHHLVFVVQDETQPVILAADAAKNRTEVMSGIADSTVDAEASARSIKVIRDLWLRKDGTVLICGHDLPLVNDGGNPRYVGSRRAGISAIFESPYSGSKILAFGEDKNQ